MKVFTIIAELGESCLIAWMAFFLAYIDRLKLRFQVSLIEIMNKQNSENADQNYQMLVMKIEMLIFEENIFEIRVR